MKTSTSEGPDSQTVNLVEARRKKVGTSLSCRLHIQLNYLLNYRNKQQQGKTKNQPTKPKTSASSYDQMEFPLAITSLRNDITLHQHFQISTGDTDQLSSETHDMLSYTISKPS